MRFLHTADWQIGMKCSAGARAGEARNERLKTVDRIVETANERAVDFMLIAGDLFDGRTPRAGDIGLVVAALNRARMPVFVLPGNHDPAGDQGPYGAPAWSGLRGTHVTTIEHNGFYTVAGGELLVSPCTAKYGTDDPTGWFAEHESPPGVIRIGMAHGTLQFGEIARATAGNTRGNFPIAPDAASRARLDYLALGDWHSYTVVPNGEALIVYSGTPEPTGFGERDNGTVSIVTIDGPGLKPRIERIPVGGLHWVQREFEVSDDASIAALGAELMGLPSPEKSFVRAIVRGLCTPSADQQLRGLEATFENRFMHFNMKHDYAARPQTRDAWMSLMPLGDLRLLVEDLLDRIERREDAAVATRALDKLAEFAR